GVEAGAVQNRIFGSEKLAEFCLEFFMKALGAANETHRGEAVTPAVEGGMGGFDDLRMLRQAEVIIGAHIENRLAISHPDVGILGRGNNALAFESAGGANFFDLPRKMGLEGRVHIARLFPVQDDLARIAGEHGLEPFLELRIRKTMSDDRAQVEAALQ